MRLERDNNDDIRITFDRTDQGIKLCEDAILFNSGDHPFDAMAIPIDAELGQVFREWANRLP